ncbi:CCA tRNA nucleotidyltransferase [Shimia sp. SDUM112013]|uniref:CCA tRNA nucleotidyltransferase n=1 Tax=Shimia sp. SDUM112013 TaxID=3136160 RepID=UPI0032EC64E1
MTMVSGAWLANPQTQAVCAMLTDAGYQALFVGGCVRNALIGTPVNDIDIATDALPETVVDLARKAGLHPIPTGIDHGTITVVSDHIPHEITTFRKDVETDGRRAVVAFSSDVNDDAHRRDFTMNAIYAHPDGTIVDPLNGMADLGARRVRFIDDADLRIREDFLRILRFFRFHAWYGDPESGMDADALAAIAENCGGLETLSKERVGAEMLKLLTAPDPAPSVAVMRGTGVLNVVLPGADDRALGPLVYWEEQACKAPDAIRRLSALGGTEVDQALRLSKKQSKLLALLSQAIGSMLPLHEVAYRHGEDVAWSVGLLRAAVLEMPVDPKLEEDIALGVIAVFPVRPSDLQPELQGPALGARLRQLENEWIASRFSLTRKALLAL